MGWLSDCPQREPKIIRTAPFDGNQKKKRRIASSLAKKLDWHYEKKKKTLRRSQAWGLNLTSIFVSLSLTTEWDPLWRPRSVCAAYSPGRAQEFESAITGVACHRARTDGVACIELHCGVSRSTREAAIGRCCKQKREGKWGLNLKGFLFVDFQTRKKVSRS